MNKIYTIIRGQREYVYYMFPDAPSMSYVMVNEKGKAPKSFPINPSQYEEIVKRLEEEAKREVV